MENEPTNCPKCTMGKHPECERLAGRACSCECTDIRIGSRVRSATSGPGTVARRTDYLAGVILDDDGSARTYGLSALKVIPTTEQDPNKEGKS